MKRLVIILFLASVCLGDTYMSHQKPITDGTLDIGTSFLLWRYIYGDSFTDGTALWKDSALTGFASIRGDVLTDGEFVISGGTVRNGIWHGTAIDISSYTNLVDGTNITLLSDTLNVDDAFLVNDADDTTTGILTALGFTTTGDVIAGTVTAGGSTFGDGGTTDYTKFSDLGAMTMYGDARVKNELVLDASVFRIPLTNPAAEGELQIAGSTIYHPVFEFDPTGAGADEQLFLFVHMPEYIDSSVNAEIYIIWQPDDGDGGTDNYEWNIDYVVTNDMDFDYTAGSAITITEDVTPANATTVLETGFSDTIDINGDQILWARIWLDKSDSGADDDGNLLFVEVEFVQNRIGEHLLDIYHLLLETGDDVLLEGGGSIILENI